jgi:hypothetical protein
MMQLGGLRVIVSPDRPRYVLPDEVIPGVPWPPGFRDEINAWSASFLGTWNVVPEGQALVMGNNTVLLRAKQYAMLKKSADVKAYEDAEHDRKAAEYLRRHIARLNQRA